MKLLMLLKGGTGIARIAKVSFAALRKWEFSPSTWHFPSCRYCLTKGETD